MTEENLADIELLTEMQLNSFDILLLMNVLP